MGNVVRTEMNQRVGRKIHFQIEKHHKNYETIIYRYLLSMNSGDSLRVDFPDTWYEGGEPNWDYFEEIQMSFRADIAKDYFIMLRSEPTDDKTIPERFYLDAIRV